LNQLVFVLLITILAYYYIIFGKGNKAVIVFGLGLVLFMTKIIEGMEPSNLSHIVDFNTLGLLFGMMIVVSFMKKTGFFQYSAIKVVRLSKARFWRMTALLMVLVALTSAFLDNLITIILVSPMLFLISDNLGMDATPLILLAIFIDNIGGMSTLIGSPLNIVLGSTSGLSFGQFLVTMGPIAIVAFVITLLIMKRSLPSSRDVADKMKVLSEMEASRAITDRSLLMKTLYVFMAVLVGFALHNVIKVELSVMAMLGAVVLLILSKRNFESIAEDIDWDTLFFYGGLYMISYALEHVGVINFIAGIFEPLVEHQLVMFLIMVWLSAIVVPFLSAVPATLIFAPIIQKLISMGFDVDLWWAYAIGANLGSSLSPLGALQNLVGLNLLAKQTGKEYPFMRYVREAARVCIPSLIAGSAYIIWLYVR